MSADEQGVLMTRAEAGERLRTSEWAIGRLIRRGELVEHRFGTRSLISEADLEAYVAAARRVRR